MSLFAGLRVKLVLLVIIGTAIAVTAIGAVRVHEDKLRIVEDMRRSGEERVTTTAEALVNLLVGFDYTNMESLAERLVQQQDVRHVVIRNKTGKIMVTRSKPEDGLSETLPFQAPVYFDGRKIGSVSLELSLARMTKQIARTYREVILEQIVFGLILGVLIYFATSQVIVKPIRRISRHMQDLIDSDDHTASANALKIPNRDEIGDLARIFCALNRKVHEAQQRLQEKVDLAGTALMDTNRQLQQRTEELEKRSQDLEKAMALLERLAVTDSLTELRNRRYFDDTLNAAFARAQRSGEAVTLIVVDIDHFKKINDTYGHAAGDAVLQRLAKLFKERTREADIAARLGGDEFAFLLFHSDRQGSAAFADSILAASHQLRFVFDGAEVRIGLSIGLACSKDGIQSVEALYGAADQVLYEAKRHGRDQVVVYACPPQTAPPKAKIVTLQRGKTTRK